MSFRGVGVDTDFHAEQQSLDGHFKMGPAASGLGDYTREQMEAMKREERKRFLAMVALISLMLFGMTYVLADVAGLDKLITLPSLSF